MASTNKTPNIALNQWVLEDPFLMEDMNEDNRKIDEDAKRLQGLIDAMPYVKLMDTTTSSDAQSVSLNVSGIDFKKYAAIHIFADAVVRDANDEIPSYSNPTLALAINGQGGWFGSTNSGSIQPYVACSVQSHYSSCAMQATISGFQYQPHAGKNGTYYHNLAVHSVGAVNREPASHSACACNIGGASSRVTSLDFTARSSENHTMYIKAGSRFVIYGVKL